MLETFKGFPLDNGPRACCGLRVRGFGFRVLASERLITCGMSLRMLDSSELTNANL